jgi:hypothetical protein
VGDRLSAICAVRGGVSGLRSFIEEARIRWSPGQNEVDAGFLSQRYGFSVIYRPYSISHFLFDKPLLLDAYGFGLGYKRLFGRHIGASAGSTLGTRENGQAHALVSMNFGPLTSALFGAFESYSEVNQDNAVSSGMELRFRWNGADLHGIAKYSRYLGFDHASNSTMVPGESTIGFMECAFFPASSLAVTVMSYVQNSRKRYLHSFYFEGIDLSWMMTKALGAGCGCEWQKDDAVETLMPRVFVKAVPSAGRAGLEIFFQPTIIRGEISSYRLSGELWLRL